MSVEQARTIIDHTRDFHQRISSYYHRLADSTQQERVKLLLDYMCEHEKRLALGIEEYENSAPDSILNTWFLTPECTDATKFLEDIPLKSDLSVETIVELGIKATSCVMQVYKTLAEQAEPESVRQVFSNLLQMEEKSQQQFVRDAGLLADL